jgi:hypothetical protein
MQIALAEGAENVGIASMLAQLIRQNLEQVPRKWTDFQKLNTSVFIDVPDAEVSVTLVFTDGALMVHAGMHGEPRIRITTSADVLLGLCMLKVVNGVPRPLHRHSRALIGNMLRGKARIAGILSSPVQLIRFARLLSVNG